MDSLTTTDLRAVGEFRLLARLGAGGMGQVFLGSSLAGRMVAVKVIHRELCQDAEFVRRFRNEVEAAQKVSGWYTAPVVAAGVDDNPPWLATAFVPGPSLDDIVSRHGPLPPAAVWRLAAGLAEALRAIHGAGLVHRDLKPANALRVADGTRAWEMDTGVPAIYKRTWAVDGGGVIVTTDAAAPRAYDAATGAKGVSFSTREPYLLALSAAGGILYAIDAFGDLYAFHTATGAEIWHKQLLDSDDPPGTGLTVDGGSIYVGTTSGTLYKVDAADGRVLWTYHPGSGMASDVAAANGAAYLRDNNGTLHAVNATTSKQLWSRTATAAGIYGPAVAGGRLYYTTALAVQALDAKSNTPVWAFTAPNNSELLSTPAVASGLVFVGCYDDGLYAIKA
jgi:hypothetical protein